MKEKEYRILEYNSRFYAEYFVPAEFQGNWFLKYFFKGGWRSCRHTNREDDPIVVFFDLKECQSFIKQDIKNHGPLIIHSLENPDHD